MDTVLGLGPEPRRKVSKVRRRPDRDTGKPSTTPRPAPTPTRLSRRGWTSGAHEEVRRRAGGTDPLGGLAVPEAIESVLRRRLGSGVPLSASVEQEMSAGFGTDLTGVRVHTDPEAAQISRQLQAVAFTRGQDIYFGTGAYQPETGAGRELLAHELAHVVQQRRSSTPGSGPHDVIGRADDPAERQADDLAARVVRRSPAPPGVSDAEVRRPTGSAVIRRRVMSVGEVDDEVEVAHERLVYAAQPHLKDAFNFAAFSLAFETTDALDPEPEQEILVGHGNNIALGGMSAEAIVQEILKRTEKDKKYNILFYACNTGIIAENGSLASTVVNSLKLLDRTVSVLAPTNLAFVLADHSFALGSPYRDHAPDKTLLLKVYDQALRDVLRELIESVTAAPPTAPEADFTTDLVTLGKNQIRPVKSSPKIPARIRLLDAVQAYQDSKVPPLPLMTNVDPLKKKIKLFLELASYQKHVSADVRFTYPELAGILDRRARRNVTDPASLEFPPAPGTTINHQLPNEHTPGWLKSV